MLQVGKIVSSCLPCYDRTPKNDLVYHCFHLWFSSSFSIKVFGHQLLTLNQNKGLRRLGTEPPFLRAPINADFCLQLYPQMTIGSSSQHSWIYSPVRAVGNALGRFLQYFKSRPAWVRIPSATILFSSEISKTERRILNTLFFPYS